MKIKQEYSIRNIAGENVVVLHGSYGVNKTRIVGFNQSAFDLWEALFGSDFSIEDAAAVLVNKYEIDSETARRDAQQWVDTLKDCGLLDE